ncbi:helix-turn-helix domain-containing protein [Vibrio parahaemolyticus]|uniref:helix-turn-helix domain-containing protein n=1 Tax=Vibrio parahaemolyticus TaxID=670 RepID=UPI00226A6BA8|nr:helix-turn-helix transcriptional regulator [Vibrio parahaemolyticus]MCX8828208.1 helix-turn-helix transcriptional regulator [Vibrio parahaemolyticus]MCX8929048.1 helix-turn-helix transcriptional regulator [Vibrio parahaemolyticus]
MHFRQFLRERRVMVNLSQHSLIDKLIEYNEAFSSLTLATYGRWERGVASPSTKKKILLASFFHANKFDFIKNTEINISKTKVKQFHDFFEKIDYLGQFNSLLGYNSQFLGEHKIIKYDEGHTIDKNLDYNSIEKLSKFNVKMLGLKRTSILSVDERTDWQLSGNLIYYVYYNILEGIHAHSAWSLHRHSDFELLVNLYKNSLLSPQYFGKPSSNEDCFIFIHALVFSTKEWNRYVFKELIKTLLRDNRIKYILISTWLPIELLDLHSVFFSEIIATKKNEMLPQSIKIKLIRIDVEDFLGNHGIINWIKNDSKNFL